ncbi:MAG: HAMP domain-containing protein [Ignavibacteriae bacterium]|nr:HAMP domain-containing protein [Ignavibacteriota bacterium]
MAVLIIVELLTLWFAIHILSSVRAFVGAEGLWSKAQKDASYYLQKYSRTHNEEDYKSYLRFMAVPAGDHKTRLELEKTEPNMDIARQGFIEGKIHPDDIDGMIKLFRRFSDIYYINKAILCWIQGDSIIAKLTVVGEKLHTEINSKNISEANIVKITEEIDPINQQLTIIEDNFSYTLGEGSRWLENLILKLLFSVALSVEITGLFLSISVSKGITKGLNEINRATRRISEGDLTERAKIFLTDEIGEVAGAVNKMTEDLIESKKHAEEMYRLKSSFLANMSHELRTPLVGILGFSELLTTTSDLGKVHEFSEFINFSGKRLMETLNLILDISRIEAGETKLQFEEIDIIDKIEETINLFSISAKNKNLKLTYESSVSKLIIVSDAKGIDSILSNLINNAIKFTSDGVVKIKVNTMKEENSNWIVIDVVDTGIGIVEKDMDMIFQEFRQASEGLSRSFEGTGLGLSVTKKYVNLLGGSISVASTLGKGSNFTVKLPLEAVHHLG